MLRFTRFFILLTLISILVQPFQVLAAQPQSSGQGPEVPQAYAWYDGLIQYSKIINCVSIIQGLPYEENGIGTYVGFSADPNSGQPAINTTYYVHVVIGGLGNACNGQRAYIDIQLPTNTSLAINNTDKVACYYDGGSLPANQCPQVFQQSSYNPGSYWIPSVDSAHAYAWPIPTGHILEIQIPVRSSTVLSNSAITAHVWSLDGNSSPWLHPQQGIYVFSNQPAILYPSPSTIDITASAAKSYAYLYAFGLGGTAYFDPGTTTSYGAFSDSAVISAGGTAWELWTDWTPFTLQPDTLYHYRLRFAASNGQTYIGNDQTFRTLPNGQSTVGNGQAASCTTAALITALSSGNNIIFNCGSVPVTITLSSTLSINGTKSLDGGNKVALAAPSNSRHFNVASSSLTLKNITLTGGSSSTCGGSIYVDSGGWLVTDGARFVGNATSNNGGALCINQTGYANVNNTLFLNNTASSGGAIWNYGTLEMFTSDVSGNSASLANGIGGGVGNDANATFAASYSLFSNNSAANGGGIYRGSVLYHSTVSGNYASQNGGGISGQPLLSNVTIAGNVASSCVNGCAQGGGVYGNVTLQNSILSGNLLQNCPSGFLTPVVYSNGYNLSSDGSCYLVSAGDQVNRNPLLGPLQNNKGYTRTHALLVGSPAIDAGSNAFCVSHTGSTSGVTDQRGVSRPVDSDHNGSAVCDIGAFEAPVYWPVYLPLTVR